MNTNEKTLTKSEIVTMLIDWVNQKPGLSFADYGNDGRSAFFQDQRNILQAKKDFFVMLKVVNRNDDIKAEDIINGFSAYSGRLKVKQNSDNKFYLDYTTGQYFPTEYRAVSCAILARVLWNYFKTDYESNEGEKIREMFKNMFGVSIQKRWFN